MKDIDLEKLEGNERILWKSFNNMLKYAEYNLDRYTSDHRFGFEDITKEDYDKIQIDEFLDVFPFLVVEYGPDYFYDNIMQLDDKDTNCKFAKWLKEYAENILKNHEKVKVLLDYFSDNFEKEITECFQYTVLEQKTVKEIVEEKELQGDDEKRLELLYSIVDKYLCEYIYHNFSKKKVYLEIYKAFGISEEQCDMIYRLLKDNELLVRNIYNMKLQVRMYKKMEKTNDILENFFLSISEYNE